MPNQSFPNPTQSHLATPTTASLLSSSRVGGSRSDVFDAADLHAGTGKGTESSLTTGTRSHSAITYTSTTLGHLSRNSFRSGENHTASPSKLDVQSVNALLLAFSGSILGSQHCGIRGRFISISLDLHATRDTRNRLTAAGKQVSILGSWLLGVTTLCWSLDFGDGTNLMSVM